MIVESGAAREALTAYVDRALDVDLADLPANRPELAPTIDDQALCSCFAVLVIRNVDDREAPAWLRNRLHAAGVEPVSGLVDVGNYVMLELGRRCTSTTATRSTAPGCMPGPPVLARPCGCCPDRSWRRRPSCRPVHRSSPTNTTCP
jgi:hypothetical protein